MVGISRENGAKLVFTFSFVVFFRRWNDIEQKGCGVLLLWRTLTWAGQEPGR